MIHLTRSTFFNYYLPIGLSALLLAVGGFAWLIFRAQPALAAISVVQAKSNVNNGAGAVSVTFTATTGNLIYVVVGMNASGAGCGTLSVSDTAGNNYAPVNNYVNRPYNCSRDFYAKNITGGSITVSATASPDTRKLITVYEVSGLDTISPLDVNNVSKTCDASPCTSSSFSTAYANEIVFVSATDYYGGAWTAGTIGGVAASIAANGSQALGGDQLAATAIEYVIFNSTQSSITGSIAHAGTVYMDFFAASFKQASAAASPPANHGLIIQNAKAIIRDGKLKIQAR